MSQPSITSTQIDPLAQTFLVEDPNGIFLTRVGLFFSSKATSGDPITLEIRPTYNGAPSTTAAIPGSQVSLNPAAITTSEDASEETFFEFEEPIYLAGGPNKLYSFVVKSNVKEQYKLWGCYVGDFELGTTVRRVTRNAAKGDLYKASAGLAYVPEVNGDLKYKLYRAAFASDTGYVALRPSFPGPRNLTADPLSMTASSGTISVYHPAHGFLEGNKVTISGLTNGTSYNGILGSAINGSHVITAVDTNNYQFEISGASATATGNFGGNVVYATEQVVFDTAQVNIPNVKASGSGKVEIQGYFVTSRSLPMTEEEQPSNVGTGPFRMPNNDDFKFNEPYVIYTPENEELNLDGRPSASVIVQMINQTGSNKVAPYIDLQRAQMMLTRNLIDRQDSSATVGFNVPFNYVDETSAAGGSALSKHITKPVRLSTVATGIKVIFAANRPADTYLHVYYRTLANSGETDINTIDWTLATIDTEMPNDTRRDTFREYVYTIGGEYGNELDEFDAYQIKIVFESKNSAAVPRIRDLRTIALGKEY